MKERHRANMNDSTSPLTPRGEIWRVFLDTGKVEAVPTRRRRSDGAVCPVQGYRLTRKDDATKKR